MGDWRLRTFEAGLETKINHAFNFVFSQSRTLEEWNWKFLQCPWGHAILVAESSSGDLLAHFAATPVAFQVATETHLVGQAVDAFRTDFKVTVPGEQNVYRATARAFVDLYCHRGPLELLYALPGPHHAQVMVKHLGWQAVGHLSTLEFRLERVRSWKPPRSVLVGCNLELWLKLWAKVRERFRVVACRDEAFVRWRYLLHPAHPYRFLFSWDGEEAHAAAVLRVRGDRCFLVDILWDGQSPDPLVELLHAAAYAAKDWGCSFLYTWLHGDPLLVQTFVACGWVPSALYSDITVTAISARDNLDPQSFWDQAFITMADGDLI